MKYVKYISINRKTLNRTKEVIQSRSLWTFQQQLNLSFTAS